MIHLTPEQIDARRLEYAQVEEQIRVLGRRKSILKSEILLGYALPAKGIAPEQLSLDTATTTATATATPLPERVFAALEKAKARRSANVLATLLGESGEAVHEAIVSLIEQGRVTSCRGGGYETTARAESRRGKTRNIKPGKAAKKPAPKPPSKPAPKAKPAPPAKKLRAPRPTKTIREAKPKILDSYPVETWAEGFYSVVGLISANGFTRGAWLLLHAKPNATVAAEVLDLLEQADLITTGDTIKLGAVLQSDIDAQPGARLGYLLAKRVGEWVCELVASSAKPPTVDTLAKLTGLHRGLFCALLNALEDEGLVKRSKGGGAPVWVVPAQARTLPLIPGVDPAPASEEAPVE